LRANDTCSGPVLAKFYERWFFAGKEATKTILLHMEDFKIPENLGRFAVKAGVQHIFTTILLKLLVHSVIDGGAERNTPLQVFYEESRFNVNFVCCTISC
jgi:hypothetical protein